MPRNPAGSREFGWGTAQQFGRFGVGGKDQKPDHRPLRKLYKHGWLEAGDMAPGCDAEG